MTRDEQTELETLVLVNYPAYDAVRKAANAQPGLPATDLLGNPAPENPRVITRVLSDGISTKDGCS